MAETAEIEPAPSSIADGVERQLDPEYIPLQREIGWIVTGVISAGGLLGVLILWLSGQLPGWGNALLLPAWLAATGGIGWLCYALPPIEFRHFFYKLDDQGIEIRAGIFWRSVTSVPRSRVQHIDVSQGPMERSHDLSRLVIYTAGTDHSRVELPGLRRAIAFELRNHLLPRGADDAV
jgi:uncharacterized protein